MCKCGNVQMWEWERGGCGVIGVVWEPQVLRLYSVGLKVGGDGG